MKMDKKTLLIAAAVIIVLVVAGFVLMGRKDASKKVNSDNTPTEGVMPTIDSSVKVNLEATGPDKKEVVLTASNLPQGTTSVDYELSYQTAQQGLQGVIGTVDTTGKDSLEKKLTLGTCSSGTCVYHQVVGSIKLTLKFSGDYGEKIFEKDYQI